MPVNPIVSALRYLKRKVRRHDTCSSSSAPKQNKPRGMVRGPAYARNFGWHQFESSRAPYQSIRQIGVKVLHFQRHTHPLPPFSPLLISSLSTLKTSGSKMGQQDFLYGSSAKGVRLNALQGPKLPLVKTPSAV